MINKNQEAMDLGLLITHFCMSVGVVGEEGLELDVASLRAALVKANDKFAALEEKVAKVGKVVDIFWERQGWYVVEVATGTLSVEHPSIDHATKSAAAQGYIIRDIRRTRGSVAQPKPPAVERRDAE